MASGEKGTKSVILEKKIPEYNIRSILLSNIVYFLSNYIKSN